MKKIKNLGIILLPLILGSISGLLNQNSSDVYQTLNLPSFAPPAQVFGIVWPVLYFIMGISLYLITQSDHPNKSNVIFVFSIQLLLNIAWPFLFFGLNAYFASSVLLVILIAFVVITIIQFYEINKSASYLLVPYLLWIIFALILNISIFLNN